MRIAYQDHCGNITEKHLQGFFVGWPIPPSTEAHLEIIKNSQHVVLALDEDTGNVVGFIYAISDGILCAFVPMLEVLPEYQHRGIGSELVRRLFSALERYYSIDLVCDDNTLPFYDRFSMLKGNARMLRNRSAISA